MKKTNHHGIIIIGIIIISLILLFSGIFKNTKQQQKLNNPEDMLQINLYDANGHKIINTNLGLQSVVGGIGGVTFINFDTIVQNTGDVPLLSVRLSTTTPAPLAAAYSNATMISTLAKNNTIRFSSALIPVKQFEGQTVTFFVEVTADYYTSEGVIGTIKKSGSKIVTIIPDPCSDGTPLNTCSPTKPLYCNALGTLVNQSSTCGCPIDYESSGETCIHSACIGGTFINTCTTSKPQYCNNAKTLIDNCATCGCPKDFYNNDKLCNVGNGTCSTQEYNVNFIITVGYT
jgi:hypothetical protein